MNESARSTTVFVKFLKRAGISRWDDSPKSKRVAIATNCVIFGLFVGILLASAWFLLTADNNCKRFSEALLIVLGFLFLTAWYLILICCNKNYVAILEELETIMKKRMEDPIVESIYKNSNEKVQIWTNRLRTIFCILLRCYCFLPIVVSAFEYISSDYSNESFRQILPAIYPFDWKTPLGYIGSVIIQTLTAYAAVEVYKIGIILTFGCCEFIACFVFDIEENLRQFNIKLIEWKNLEGLIIEEDKELRRNFDRKRFHEMKKKIDLHIKTEDELRTNLNGIMRFYSEAREFAIRFTDTNNAIVFTFLTFVVVSFGSFLLQIKRLASGDIAEIVIIAIQVFAFLFALLMFCHFGGNLTKRFEDVGNAVYELNWYDLPVDMQKDLLKVIMISQKPIYMRGFGDTCTTHSAFAEILKHKFYFFIIKISLRRIGH